MKFLYSDFNYLTGESTVTLQDRNGIYKGKAKLHPDDRLFQSEYTGCHIAQQRAWLQYYKKRLSNLKIKRNTIQSLQQEIINNCHYKEISDGTKQINRRINLTLKSYNTQIKNIEDTINTLKFVIQQDIDIRNKIIQRTKKENN